MKKTIQYKKILCWFVSSLWLLPAIVTFAQADYIKSQSQAFSATPAAATIPATKTNTVPITVTTKLITAPSILKQTGIDSSSLPSLLGTVFNLGIAVAVVLALIMIILGGIEYMTTDAWTKKEEGRQRITDALLGLGLALVCWLLLDIINPTLVTFCGNLLVGKSC